MNFAELIYKLRLILQAITYTTNLYTNFANSSGAIVKEAVHPPLGQWRLIGHLHSGETIDTLRRMTKRDIKQT